MMKNKGCTRSPSMMKPNNMEGILGPDSLDDMVGFPDSVDLPWDQVSKYSFLLTLSFKDLKDHIYGLKN